MQRLAAIRKIAFGYNTSMYALWQDANYHQYCVPIQQALLSIAVQLQEAILASFLALRLNDIDSAEAEFARNQATMQHCEGIANTITKALSLVDTENINASTTKTSTNANMGNTNTNSSIGSLLHTSMRLVQLYKDILHMCKAVCLQVTCIHQQAIRGNIALLEPLANTINLMLKCLLDAYIQQDQSIAHKLSSLYKQEHIVPQDIAWSKETADTVAQTITRLLEPIF